jgi:alpha-glucoside transport system substrate-binding protein
MSASVKGLIFTNTAVWTGDAPTTWDEMISTAEGLKADANEQLWCMGLESGAASGWPGTDWIENILLRQAGPDVYDSWSRLELEWTDQAVVDAFTTFNDVVANTFGGANAIVNTNFGRGGNGLFSDPAECVLFQQATFMTDFFQNEAGATPDQFDFFRMPDINSEFQGGVMGGGNLVGMFNDTPAARSLMEWLVTADAQRIWVERGGFLAANTDVSLDAYVDDANRGSAEILQNADVFRFDASDLMPGEMQDAFHSAMVNVVQNPGNLQSILEGLEATRLDVVANQ